MRAVRILLWALVAVAIAGFIYLQTRPSRQNGAGEMGLTQASFGGPFTLVGSDGKPFSSSQLGGKPYAVFFGFTHCPDVCPTALARLVKLRRDLGKGEDSFNIVFISVDPERDRPEQVATYEQAFGGPVIALTGSPEQIAKVKRDYGIFSSNVADGSGGYTVDHTATVLLFDRNGNFAATISPEEQDRPALDKLRRLTA